jgi:hypothetical protein
MHRETTYIYMRMARTCRRHCFDRLVIFHGHTIFVLTIFVRITVEHTVWIVSSILKRCRSPRAQMRSSWFVSPHSTTHEIARPGISTWESVLKFNVLHDKWFEPLRQALSEVFAIDAVDSINCGTLSVAVYDLIYIDIYMEMYIYIYIYIDI